MTGTVRAEMAAQVRARLKPGTCVSVRSVGVPVAISVRCALPAQIAVPTACAKTEAWETAPVSVKVGIQETDVSPVRKATLPNPVVSASSKKAAQPRVARDVGNARIQRRA